MPMHQTLERARSKLRHAVKTGRLHRPATCEQCGVNPGYARDGRTLIQGHHHNGYDNPYDVQWLCFPCHRAVTPTPSGENNPKAKLTVEAVRDIRASNKTDSDLAALYEVSRWAVGRIRRRQAWINEALK